MLFWVKHRGEYFFAAAKFRQPFVFSSLFGNPLVNYKPTWLNHNQQPLLPPRALSAGGREFCSSRLPSSPLVGCGFKQAGLFKSATSSLPKSF